MLFYVSSLSACCAERIVQFMSMAYTSKINHKILIGTHKSSSQHGKSIKRKSKKYAASQKKKNKQHPLNSPLFLFSQKHCPLHG